jgi:hypothetical protein
MCRPWALAQGSTNFWPIFLPGSRDARRMALREMRFVTMRASAWHALKFVECDADVGLGR